MTHVLQGDDVGMLSVSQQDLHLLRRVSLGLVDDLSRGQTVLRAWDGWRHAAGSEDDAEFVCFFYLDGVLHAGPFVKAALTDGVGPDADVLFDLVGV